MWLPDSDTADHNDVDILSIDELMSGNYIYYVIIQIYFHC